MVLLTTYVAELTSLDGSGCKLSFSCKSLRLRVPLGNLFTKNQAREKNPTDSTDAVHGISQNQVTQAGKSL